jgi:hypothetical protein
MSRRLRILELTQYERADLSDLPRIELEDLAWRFRELLRSLANRLGEDSMTSSRPPSSDDPYRRGASGESPPGGRGHAGAGEQDAPAPAGDRSKDKACKGRKPAKPPGKRPGMPGHWRRQPIVVSQEVDHLPTVCGACQTALGADRKGRCVSAHHVFELDRGEMGLQVTASKHSYFAAICACGHQTVAK